MSSGRREFLENVALGTLGMGLADALEPASVLAQAGSHWDFSWTEKLKGKRRAVFDVAGIEDGFGVWRAMIWRRQYSQVFNLPESSLSTVVVLRHDAVVLALNNTYWERYGIAAANKVRDPSNGEACIRNPVFDRTGPHALPPQFADYTLEGLMAGGAIILACALALRDAAMVIAKQEKVSDDEADHLIHGMLVPGIIVQPSGIFAVVLAQDNGCKFVRAS